MCDTASTRSGVLFHFVTVPSIQSISYNQALSTWCQSHLTYKTVQRQTTRRTSTNFHSQCPLNNQFSSSSTGTSQNHHPRLLMPHPITQSTRHLIISTPQPHQDDASTTNNFLGNTMSVWKLTKGHNWMLISRHTRIEGRHSANEGRYRIQDAEYRGYPVRNLGHESPNSLNINTLGHWLRFILKVRPTNVGNG